MKSGTAMVRNIIIFVILIVLVVLKKKGYGRVSYYIQLVICIVHTLRVYFLNRFTYNWLINLLLGILLAPILFKITCYMFYNLKVPIKYYINMTDLLLIIREEFVWRSFALGFLTVDYCHMSWKIIWIILSTGLFVFYHDRIELNDFAEMYIYSIFLAVGYLILPGINLGLHWERNCIIYTNERENNEL